ncbi:MAG: DNA-3-methyladenine glycosylase I [Pseudomonadota bacterium]
MVDGTQKVRCAWAGKSPLEQEYHDTEWGVPLHDDRSLFEFLVLEGAQAGLSWTTILRKREGYREAFCGFQPDSIAGFSDSKVEELLTCRNIVRNRLKIESTIRNARAFLRIVDEFGTFDAYIWQFVNGRPIRNAWSATSEVPASTRESHAMSKDLKKRGFSFVGTTICYAFMQAVGMVNDHTTDCFRWAEIDGEASSGT